MTNYELQVAREGMNRGAAAPDGDSATGPAATEWRPRPRQPAGPMAAWITIAVLLWSGAIALGPLLFSSLPWWKAAQAGMFVMLLAGGFLGAWWLLMLNRSKIQERREAIWQAEQEAGEREK